MTMQPAGLQDGITGAERLLFTRGPRLGWVFRDRRQAIAPYAEPEPDPQATRRAAHGPPGAGERAWRFSLRWVARPLLPLAVVLYAAGALARDATHRAHPGTLAWLPFALAAAGVAWPAWCLARLVLARRADPARVHQAALDGWRQRAGRARAGRARPPRRGPGVGQRLLPCPAHRRLRRHPGRLAVAAGRARRLGPGRAAAAGRRLLRPARQQRADRPRPPPRRPGRRLPRCPPPWPPPGSWPG